MSWSDPCSKCGEHRADCECRTIIVVTNPQSPRINLINGQVTLGIEPVFSSEYLRLIRLNKDKIKK